MQFLVREGDKRIHEKNVQKGLTLSALERQFMNVEEIMREKLTRK